MPVTGRFKMRWSNVGSAIYQHPKSQAAIGHTGKQMALSARSSAAAAAAQAGPDTDRAGKMAAAQGLRLKNVKPFPSPKARALVRGKGVIEIPVALVVGDHPSTMKLEDEEGEPVARAAETMGGSPGYWFKKAKRKKRKRKQAGS